MGLAALRENALPFDRAGVQLLVRQALYQVGTLEGGGGPTRMGWKADFVEGGVLSVLCAELEGFAELIADKVSAKGALLAVVDVLCYASDSARAPAALEDDDMAEEDGAGAVGRVILRVRQKCLDIAEAWTRALETSVETAIDPESAMPLRATQCVLAMYAVLAHGGTAPLLPEECRRLLLLLVRAHHGYVFQANAADPAGFAALRRRCEVVMALRVRAVVVALDTKLLSDAVRSVLGRGVPAGMKWAEVCAADGCFEAVSEDRHLYSVNVLTGAVLLDGLPPRSLPQDVLAHPLYLRTFGARDFEIVADSTGALRTIRKLGGCFYEFVKRQGGLRILEISVGAYGAEDCLELLEADSSGKCEWGADLPVRLRTLHSHWLSREAGVVLVRPITVVAVPMGGRGPAVTSREVSFVISVREEWVNSVPAALLRVAGSAVCAPVEAHLRGQPWRELVRLGARDVLVLWDGVPVPAVGKFENAAFLHWFMCCRPLPAQLGGRAGATVSAQLRVELPRYELHFEVRGGRLHSLDYEGYSLAPCQQLTDTLRGLTRYLVLEPGAGLNEQHPWAAQVKLMVPVGYVSVSGGARVPLIFGSSACGAKRAYHTYDVHGRFAEVRARFVEARLYLAALYAACDTGVPEPRSQCTAAEVAMGLVRRSFLNRPLTKGEAEQCELVETLTFRTPALHMLCYHLRTTAAQLAFLQGGTCAPVGFTLDEERERMADSVSAYLTYVKRGRCNPRQLLSAVEEVRTIGRATPRVRLVRPMPECAAATALCDPPVGAAFVREKEAALCAMVKRVPCNAAAASPCPVQRPAGADADDDLARDMHEELRDSWAANELVSAERLSARVGGWGGLVTALEGMLGDVRARLAEMERYVMEAAAGEAAGSSPLAWHVPAWRLLRAGGRVPLPTMGDLVQTIREPGILRGFNVFVGLSSGDAARLRGGVLTWLQLAVLEDRVLRMGRMAAVAAREGSEDVGRSIVKELLVRREWEAEEHPEWAVFEADGGLQIRPAQYAVAKAVLETPGAIVQLNMGEGKTRVILPMLLLEWTRRGAGGTRSQLVRLNLLAYLLPEAYDYLHEHMTGGLLRVKLFRMPFSRDVELTPGRAAALLEQVEFCRKEGGALMQSPESRASLRLKQYELLAAGAGDSAERVALGAALAKFEGLPWRDVFDESDEVLRVKFQASATCRCPAPPAGG